MRASLPYPRFHPHFPNSEGKEQADPWDGLPPSPFDLLALHLIYSQSCFNFMRQMVKKHIIPGSYKKTWVPTFSLSLNNLICHYDCNGKILSLSVNHEILWEGWINFIRAGWLINREEVRQSDTIPSALKSTKELKKKKVKNLTWIKSYSRDRK